VYGRAFGDFEYEHLKRTRHASDWLWLYAVAALVLAVVLADYDAGCPVRPTSTKRPTRKFADVPADVEKDGAALPP
jgi:hypothetical protein